MKIENAGYISTDGFNLPDDWDEIRPVTTIERSFELTVIPRDRKALMALFFPPKEELLSRLNERLQGRDPGKPLNWKGLS